MPTPRPGQRVRGSRTGRPIMAALDLLGRRWTLRVLWELRDAPLTFRALRARCDAVSTSVLMQRLSELRDVGVVAAGAGGGYALTPDGRALLRAMAPLCHWAARWQPRGRRGHSPSVTPSRSRRKVFRSSPPV